MKEINKLLETIGYEFRDRDLLTIALTHSSYASEHRLGYEFNNERLEFIGDAVLDVVVGQMIYELKPQADEGYLSKMRSVSVCEKSFAEVARRLHLGDYLLLGKGEAQSGGNDKDSTLADCFESVIAAVYFDGGFEQAKKCILKNLTETVQKAVNGEIFLDYKSRLLELAQTRGFQHRIRFEVTGERGPAHMKEFDVSVYSDDGLLASATGHSKKDAEQKCAEKGLKEYIRLYPEGC
jgi:ribonuclease-3